MPTDCGKLVSVGEPEPMPEFDPGRVTVPPAVCNVSPQEVSPSEDVELSATVRNGNDVPAAATVEWTWQGQWLATDAVNVSRISAEIASTGVHRSDHRTRRPRPSPG